MDDVIDLEFRKSLVKKQTCFSRLRENEIEELADLFVEKRFSAGERIVTEGDLVDSVFLIIDGEADVRRYRVENGELKYTSLAKLGPGESIGLSETGFYSLSGRRTATVVALTDMTTICLSVAKFNGFALSNAHVSEVMNKSARSSG